MTPALPIAGRMLHSNTIFTGAADCRPSVVLEHHLQRR